MQIPNISLAYLVAEFKPTVKGSVLRKVQELDNGWLKLRLQTRQGTKDLIAAPSALFLTAFSMPARQTTSGYGAFLRKQLANKRIVSFGQHGLDRIVVMGFEDFFLIFELFAKGNIVLADAKMQILSAFRKERWKDRALRKGEQYKFPSSKGLNPLKLEESQLQALFKESETDTVRTIIKAVNIAPAFAEAACLGAGLEKGKAAKSLSRKEIKQLAAAIRQLYSVNLEKMQPMLAKKGDEEILLPFPLNLPEVRILQRFSSVNQALDSIYSKRFEEKGSADQASKRKRKGLERSLEQQKEALEKLQQRIEENNRKAELIYANYSRLFELVQAANLAAGGKKQEKEIMYKLKRVFPFLKEVDLKRKTLVVSLPE